MRTCMILAWPVDGVQNTALTWWKEEDVSGVDWTQCWAVRGPNRRPTRTPGYREIDLDEVHRSPHQPRIHIPDEGIEELAASIESQGLMQPIVVRPRAGGGYELIAGERRWRAAQRAGVGRIQAIVREVDDSQAMAMALIENIQREALTPLEEATGLRRLLEEFGMTHEEAADAVGKSRPAVSNLLRLLDLGEVARELLQSGDIEMGHARALLPLDEVAQARIARLAAEKGLSVRQTEALARPDGGGSGRVDEDAGARSRHGASRTRVVRQTGRAGSHFAYRERQGQGGHFIHQPRRTRRHSGTSALIGLRLNPARFRTFLPKPSGEALPSHVCIRIMRSRRAPPEPLAHK